MAATYELISSTTLATATTTVTLSSIPATYDDLILRVSARNNGSGSSNDNVYCKVNNDGGSNYTVSHIYGYTGSSGVNLAGGSGTTTSITIYETDTSTLANTFAQAEIYFWGYTTANSKQFNNFAVAPSNRTGTGIISWYQGRWQSGAVISSLVLNPNAGQFIAGSSFILYGIKNT